jgi:peptidoglycan-N-acetylglucosamine deacetylase
MRVTRVAGLSAGALLSGLSAAAAYGSVAKSSQLFGPTVYRGVRSRKSVALTFDDGPSEGTAELLEYLGKEEVPATFFMCGANVTRLPQVAGEVAAGGHQLGNHTYSHPNLPFKSKAFIDQEFTETQKIIQFETGVTPMVLRAHYGSRWMGMREVQQRLSLLSVMWTVAGFDWRWPAERIAGHVLSHCAPGAIVCLHDGRSVKAQPDIRATLAAVRDIVPRLKDNGYTFETVGGVLRP